MMHYLQIAVGVASLALTYLLFRRWQYDSASKSKGCSPPKPYPHKDPILGIDLFLSTGKAIQEHTYLQELTRRYNTLGNTFRSKSLGAESVATIEPENLQAVFSTNFNDWGVEPVRLPAQAPFCGKGFITTDGPVWEHSRGLLRPSFNKSKAVDLAALENGYLDTSTQFLFGEPVNSLSGNISKEAEAFLKAFDHAMLGSGIRIALGPFKVLFPTSQWRKSCETTHKFAEKYVAKALEYRASLMSEPSKERDAVNAKRMNLLQGMAEQTDDPFTLRNEILQALMAAQETTASLICNVFFLLSRHKPVWRKLHQEVVAIGDCELNAEALQSIPLLRNVLNEALRLYPVFPQMNRIALKDTTLPTGGGPTGTKPIFVPKGTNFDTSWYNLHRLPSIWGVDADEFKPERWDYFKPGPWQFVPFGGGPRGCLGRTKALTEASYVTVRILQEFSNIESRDDRDWTGQVQLTAKNANGCKIALT
ncbi:MAG: hypothetical protein Q9217_005758 [Psora testacea]